MPPANGLTRSISKEEFIAAIEGCVRPETMPPRKDQISIPAAWIRGGSSKAVFYHEKDVPPEGPVRDCVLKRVMGTPDPIQIDGLGGAKAVTSKIAIIHPSQRDDADIDYIFAQSGVAIDEIDYTANCGNISSGVGPFAIDEGLISRKDFREGRSVDPEVRTQEVRIFNTGTEKVLISHVPIDEEGYSVADGEYAMAAVPGTGAPILMDYRETVGASRNRGLLPTGNAVDEIEVQGEKVPITIGDVANIVVFVNAEHMGISGQETSEALTENRPLLDRVREIRGKAAQMVELCTDWREVDKESPFLPFLVVVSPPSSLDTHLSCRLFLDNMCHPSMAGTGSCNTSAMSRTRGTVVYNVVSNEARAEKVVNIAHPLGVIPIATEVKQGTEESERPEFSTLSFIRTSRRLMDGHVYVPRSAFDGKGGTSGIDRVDSHA